MKLKIEIDESLPEEELLLRCRGMSEETLELQKQLQGLLSSSQTITAQRGELDYYLKTGEILFLETDENRVAIHTADGIYFSRKRLYELEEELPPYFMRVSKSTLLNIRKIRSIRKNITGASEVEFTDSNKKAYVSRSLYRELIARLER